MSEVVNTLPRTTMLQLPHLSSTQTNISHKAHTHAWGRHLIV